MGEGNYCITCAVVAKITENAKKKFRNVRFAVTEMIEKKRFVKQKIDKNQKNVSVCGAKDWKKIKKC